MAPITEDTAQGLHDLIHSLNNRVHALESRIAELEGKPKSPAEQMRLILMGPPGAGMLQRIGLHFALADGAVGKGTQAPKIKDKYCICHLVSRLSKITTEEPN